MHQRKINYLKLIVILLFQPSVWLLNNYIHLLLHNTKDLITYTKFEFDRNIFNNCFFLENGLSTRRKILLRILIYYSGKDCNSCICH